MTWINPLPQIKHLEFTPWKWIVSCPEHLEFIGENIDIGAMTYIQARFGVKIYSGVQVGSHCAVYSEDTIGGHSGPVVIRENSCIGTHSTIMANVEIGPNLIIPAYSFVKHSIFTQKDLDLFYIANRKDNPNRSNIDQELINSYL